MKDVVNVRRAGRVLAMLLPVLVVVLFTKPLKAHDGDGDEVRLHGTITSIDPSTSSFVVLGQTIVVDSDTRIRRDDDGDDEDSALSNEGDDDGDDDDNLPFSALQVGDFVEVRGSFLPDGTILAGEVRIQDQVGNPGQVEIKGTIQSVGTDSIVVGSTTVVVNSFTMIRDENENVVDFSSLQVGQFVEVEGTRQADGSILASEIKIENLNEGIELEGTIDAIGNMFIVVVGRVVNVDSFTRIEGIDDQLILFSDLKLGMKVEVHANQQSDGSLLAHKIEVKANSTVPTFTGRIALRAAHSVKVGNRTFKLLQSTKVKDRFGKFVGQSALKVGMRVRVAYRKAGPAFLARLVRILPS